MKKNNNFVLESHYTLILAVVLFIAFILRTFPLTFSHSWDETVYLQNAMVLFEGRTNYHEFDFRPPLLPVIFAAGFSIWNHIYVANIVEGLMATLVVLMGFLYTKKLFGLNTGLTAAFLYAFTPYFVDVSHYLHTGMPTLALMLASMYFFSNGDIQF